MAVSFYIVGDSFEAFFETILCQFSRNLRNFVNGFDHLDINQLPEVPCHLSVTHLVENYRVSLL